MADRSSIAALFDIVEAIDRIREATEGTTAEQFEADWKLQWVVERGVEIISEASRRLPGDFKAAHPEIPWSKVAGIGNILRHDYNDVASPIIWNLVLSELGPLEQVCRDEKQRLDRKGMDDRG